MTEGLSASFAKRFADGAEVRAESLSTTGQAAVTVLFGASGAGKTTVLRCLAGLERPSEGVISFDKELWFDTDRDVFVKPQQRRIGFVPQDYALFPHLTAERNIAYGLSEMAAPKRRQRVRETMDWLGLNGMEHRLPQELSGGQQQRIALARAVARRPRLLLLDEPLAALDAPTRSRLRGELRQLLRELAVPTLLVTHDRTEALALGDDLIVMDSGSIVQQGPVQEVFSRPANLAVASIVAVETVQPARISAAVDGLVTLAVGARTLIALGRDLLPGIQQVYVCIRAEDVIVVKGEVAHSSPRNALPAIVRGLLPEGPMVRIDLDCGFPLIAMLTKQACEELALRQNDHVLALIKAPHIHLIPRSS